MRLQPIVRGGDFTRAYKKGKCYSHAYVVLYVGKNRARTTRVGITTSKKLGNAPRRNRARRVLRHAVTQCLQSDLGGIDLVLVARGITADQKSWQVAAVLEKLLAKAGLLPGPGNENKTP